MRTLILLIAIALTLPLAATGCGGGKKASKALTPVQREANQKWEQLCVLCHGERGLGDGVNAKTLAVKPRNYSDPAWQAKATDADIAKAIVEGGESVGLSKLMPANPDLKDKPEVVKALVAKIRSFKK